jgi:choice-of-anchor B domain-containing protein
VLALLFSAGTASAQNILFKDVTTYARVAMPTDPNGSGHGVAIADFTGDGRPDIYLVSYDAGNSLFRNNGNGRFTDIAANAGVADGSQHDRGVAAADYDNDGDVDLYIAAASGSPHLLYRNNGDGTFDEAGSATGLRLQSFQGQGVAWGDYDNDGNLDLFLASYEHASRLYRQNREHRFEDVTEAAGLGNTAECVQAVFFDADLDGDLDLFVSRGGGFANRMFINKGNGFFADEAEARGLADPLPHGQGVTIADYDNDGDFDIYMCNSAGANRLYRNGKNAAGKLGYFREAAGAAGVADQSRSLGCTFADFDNDGRQDLYVGNFGPNRMYRNNGDGTFTEASSASGTDYNGRAYGTSVTDYDNDGLLDIFFSNSGGTSVLLRNESAKQHWLKLNLIGKESNRNGIGAIVRVEDGVNRQAQQLLAGYSMVSGGGDLTLHFGLGASARAPRVEVQWPSGKKDVLLNVEADRTLAIIEGSLGETPRDTTAPRITNVAAIVKSDTSALITWSTDEAATSQVEYGATSAYGDTTKTLREPVTRHALFINHLQTRATYHYRVLSQDSAGNKAASHDFVFTLTPAVAPPTPLKAHAQNLTSTSAEVVWQTSAIASAWLEFGADTSLGRRIDAVTSNGRAHLARITALAPRTTYYARAFARVSSHELLRSHVFNFTTTSDSSPAPVISNIEIDQITAVSARITWQTDVASDSQIEYGLDDAYDKLSNRNTQLVTLHRMTLRNLAANRLHRLRVRSAAPRSKLAQSAAYQFITLPNNGDLARNVELLGFVDLYGDPTIGGCWGYADGQGREYALVCLRARGLEVVDVTDPRQPERIARVTSFQKDLKEVQVYRHYALAINEYGPMEIIDLSNPGRPEIVALYDHSFTGAHNIFVNGHFAYVVGTHPIAQPDDDAHSGLHIIDLSDPEQPRLAGKYEEGFYIHDLYVQNDTAFIGGLRSHQVVTLDVKNKRNIRELSGFRVRYPHTVRRGGNPNVLIVNDEGKGQDVQFFDIRDPHNVRKVGSYMTDPEISPHNVEPIGDLAYIAYFEDVLRVVDYSDPTNPIEVGFYDTYPQNPSHGQPEGAHQTAAWGVYPHAPSGNIYISDMTKGLYIFRYAAPGPAPASAKPNTRALEAVATASLAKQNATPRNFSLSNYPNPFHTSTSIRFELTRAAEVDLAVLDLHGRVVKQLAASNHRAGSHDLRWNGEANDGHRVAAGIYFVRLRHRLAANHNPSQLVRRLVLLP